MIKKNKILFFIFSLIPGAAHMYIGLSKRGLVLMTAFVAGIGLGALVPVFLCILPVLWFYCFFDSWNKYSLTEEELGKVNDDFLFFLNAMPESIPKKNINISSKISKKAITVSAGLLLILSGGYTLLREVLLRALDSIEEYYSRLPVISIIRGLVYELPAIAVSVALIIAGVLLIKHKKKELDNKNESVEDGALTKEDSEELDRTATGNLLKADTPVGDPIPAKTESVASDEEAPEPGDYEDIYSDSSTENE